MFVSTEFMVFAVNGQVVKKIMDIEVSDFSLPTIVLKEQFYFSKINAC